MYQNQFNQDELLNQEELAIVRGGLMEASSAQMESCEMGSSSCCNVTIEIGKTSSYYGKRYYVRK